MTPRNLDDISIIMASGIGGLSSVIDDIVGDIDAARPYWLYVSRRNARHEVTVVMKRAI
jgi:hypothetical protein